MVYSTFESGLKKAMLRLYEEKPKRYEDRYAILSTFLDSMEDAEFTDYSGVNKVEFANTPYIDRTVESFVYMFYCDQADVEKFGVDVKVRQWTENLYQDILDILDKEFSIRKNSRGHWV